MKRNYVGWLVILGVMCAGLLAVAISPRWRHGEPIEDQLARLERIEASEGVRAEPAQGEVSRNLPQALRLRLPVVAYFCEQWRLSEDRQEHTESAAEPEQAAMIAAVRKSEAEREARRKMLTQLAAERKGAVAVVAITPDTGAVSFMRARVDAASEPMTIIYGPDDREVWRRQGHVTREQIVKELAKLNVKPSAG